MQPAERMLRHPIWQVTWRKTCQQDTSSLYNALANIENERKSHGYTTNKQYVFQNSVINRHAVQESRPAFN
jgi:hypothetical protein